MPEITIPLVGMHNQRPEDITSSEVIVDQRFVNCFFDIIGNPATQSKTVFINKRPGLINGTSGVLISAGTTATAVYKASGGVNEAVVSAWGSPNSTIIYAVGSSFSSGTNCGSITGKAMSITDISIGGVLFFLITSYDGTAWFLSESAATDATPTFTANTTSGSAVLSSVSSTTNVYVGQALTGTGIAAGARVQSVDSATQITMTANATANGTGVTVTFARVAKIIDADFPTNIVGGFAQLDGYALIMTADGKIYNSDLNSVTSWGASNFISANMSTDNGVGVARFKNQIVGFGTQGTEFFYNAGNPSGSPLSRTEQAFSGIGCRRPADAYLTYYAYKDTIYFISNQTGDGVGVYALSNFTPQKISNSVIDSYLSGSARSIGAGAHRGRDIIFLAPLDGASTALILYPETGLEVEWKFTGSRAYRFCSGGGANGFAGFIYAVLANGNGTEPADHLRFASSYYQDSAASGAPESYSLVVQTAKVDLGTGNRKTYKTVWLMGSDVQSSGSATLEYSDDDYATWVTAGTFDLTQPQPKIDRAGSHRGGRAWRLTHSENTAFRAQALKFDYTVGAH